jgi:hypothetical protein
MQGPDTDAQDHPLHLFTSGLQRTAGPYSWVNSGNSSAGYPHAVGVNRSDMFHMATSSSGREAVASRRAASRFERAR